MCILKHMDTYLYTQIKRKEKETLIVCVCVFYDEVWFIKNILSMGIKKRKPAFRKKDMPKRVV